MNKTDEQIQIRNAFINFIGAMLNSSKFNNEQATKHSIVACLLEEIVPLCKKNDEHYDLFIIKPLIRILIDIFNDRITLLLPYKDEIEVSKQINKYFEIIDELNKILKNVRI